MQDLHLDRAFGRQFNGRAVKVRAEGHAGLSDLAQRRKRHDLVAPGIGEDRQRPMHEVVQAAERRDTLGGGPQHQVIGVSEDDIGAGGAHVIVMHAFDCRLRADRHKCRRAYDAMRRRDFAAARRAIPRDQPEREWARHKRLFIGTAGKRRHRNRTDNRRLWRAHRRGASHRDCRRRRPACIRSSAADGNWSASPRRRGSDSRA